MRKCDTYYNSVWEASANQKCRSVLALHILRILILILITCATRYRMIIVVKAIIHSRCTTIVKKNPKKVSSENHQVSRLYPSFHWTVICYNHPENCLWSSALWFSRFAELHNNCTYKRIFLTDNLVFYGNKEHMCTIIV